MPVSLFSAHLALGLEQTVGLSDTIVHGKVVATTARWVTDQRGRHIYTYATLDCFDYLKGSGARQVVVEWPGGTVGEIAEEVSDYQTLSPEEEVILFLDKALRPAAGPASKSLVAHGQAASLDRTMACDEFVADLRKLTGVKAPGPVPGKAAVKTGARLGEAQVIRADTPGVSIQRLGPAGSLEAATSPQSDTPKPLSLDVIYDNTTSQNSYYPPGAGIEVLDYGTSAGGRVSQFTIGYATKLANPGTIQVRFYSGSSETTCGTFVKGWNISGLAGSPNGGAYMYTATYQIPAADQFTLPSGAFGYSYQCDNASTGPSLATGGTGNEDAFWENSDLSWFGGYPDYPYASFYMKVWATSGTDVLPVISRIDPPSAPAGIASVVTLTGTNFGATQGSSVVEFFYRSGQPKIAATVTVWSDTSITCQVPTGTVNGYSGSAGSGPVTVTTAAGTSAGYNFIVPFGYGNSRWSPPGMHYTINDNTADCLGEAAAIQAAANAWNNAGATFSFTYDGSTSATTPSLDGINEMMWGTCPAGVIAQATRWVNTSSRLIVECDIVFNDPDFTWLASGTPSSSQMDIQTIALHEMGHWLCLLDLYGNIGDNLNDNGKVMYGFCGNGVLKRALTTGDRDGIRWIYGSVVEPGYLTIARNAGAVTLTWTNGVLLQADTVLGPYSEVSGAASPYTTAPTAEQKYYQLRY